VPSGRAPLEIKHLAKSYDDLKVIQNFSANVTRGEKISSHRFATAPARPPCESIIRNAAKFMGEDRTPSSKSIPAT